MKFFIFVYIILALSVTYADASDLPENKRSAFGYNWTDDDHDCLNTRQEVLIAESLWKVTFDKDGCTVISGLWRCPYTGLLFTNPSDLDIDHVVPLKAAWYLGAWAWDRPHRKKYFNDLTNPNHLIAVSKSANRSKGAKTPNEWMPPNVAFWDTYLDHWQSVEKNWHFDERATDVVLLRVIAENTEKGFKFRTEGAISKLKVLLEH